MLSLVERCRQWNWVTHCSVITIAMWKVLNHPNLLLCLQSLTRYLLLTYHHQHWEWFTQTIMLVMYFSVGVWWNQIAINCSSKFCLLTSSKLIYLDYVWSYSLIYLCIVFFFSHLRIILNWCNVTGNNFKSSYLVSHLLSFVES